MPDSLNLIRNACFENGVTKPRSWRWVPADDGAEWSRDTADDGSPAAVTIRATDNPSTGFWVQSFRCKPDHWYRIEAEVSCECEPSGERGGATLGIRPAVDDESARDWTVLGSVTQASHPIRLRAYFVAPAEVRRLEIAVGLSEARGSATVHSVFVAPNIKPDVLSHPMALPPPPHSYPPARRVRTVCVCDARPGERPLIDLLRSRFGRSAVSVCKPSNRLPDSDALIIADDHLPREIRSMSALLRAGSRRLVIISLEAFSKIAGDAVRLRRIEQPDDPLCAKIFRADFMTRGFALHDVIPFAATAIDPRVFRQRQLRRGAGLEKLNKTHGFEIVLTAVTDADSSTGHPICLHKPMDGGGIVVLDLDPIDAPPSNRNESNPAAFILQNTLGFDQVSLGHYSVPVRDERRLRDLLELLADRYPAMRLTGSTARDTVAEIGGSTRTFGLVEDTRPAVLIRTLLTGEDVSGFYGTWYYLRHLIRPEPDASPYALQLLRSFRLIWKPVGAPLRHADAASVLDESSTDRDLPIDPSELAAVIDVTECPTNDTRVIYDRNASTAARHTEIQKTLGNSLGGDGFVYWTGPVGEEVSQFDDHGWRLETPASQVLVAPKAFRDPLHRAAAQAGARLIRIEVPQSNAAFAADSVFRTDRVATMLERVIGLRYGYLAVNRRCDAISIPGYGTLKPGEAILAPENGKSRQASKRVG